MADGHAKATSRAGRTQRYEENTLGIVVPLDGSRNPSQGLKPILELTSKDMGAVNRIILDKAVSDVELIPELAHHLIDSGGKRLRPMLTIAAAKLSGYSGDGHIQLAASVEFMHTATLLHDDVVDDSDVRRGKQAGLPTLPQAEEVAMIR